MPRIYDACHAKCPFFISSGKKNVVCEGLSEDCSVNLMFVSEEKRCSYRKTYCNSEYKTCTMFKLLDAKYE